MALNISQRLAVSLLSVTQLPFLYETRTLQQHARFVCSPRRCFKSPTRWINQPQRLAHTSASARITRDISQIEDDEALPEEAQQSSTTTAPMTSNEDTQPETNPTTSENAPETTEGSSGRRSFFKRKAAALAAASSQKGRASSAEARPSRKTLPGTTVTKWERDAFQKLYKEFGIPLPPRLQQRESTSRSKKQRTKTEPEGSIADDSAVPFESKSMEDELSQVSQIMDEALRSVQKNKEVATSDDDLGDTQAGAGSMFPRLGETLEKVSFEELDAPVNLSRIVDLVVQREGEKIENVLYQAIFKGVTDVEFWQLCQDRVFSLVRGLEEDSPVDANSTSEVDLRTKINEPPKEPLTDSISGSGNAESDTELITPNFSKYAKELEDIPEVLPRNSVIPPLYSKLLLLSFHLLRINFPTSPLLGQFWPTIQSYGRTSVLMGASTALYNELIILYGKHLDDLKKVILVLDEMELTGADPDMKTGQKIRQILRDRGALPGSKKDKQIGPQDTNRNKAALKRLLREYRSIQRRLAEIQDERHEAEPRRSPNSQLLIRNE